ncbi:gastric triacylglycerol lipase-like protein 2 [Dinothrombium tinctorium]|uniref:Gastric triacylglycerol lipase-like protein 2 n=1 Tax=Dinothrombium tinctorium TaxID=1965070 RepID=A0A3S3NJ78_9ACAR|nr:gastric triacylglycerol lipase-like protein 2 [Dinothrombium tinctorium]RWS03732.1 gastric triacylglycerol lipase-like protein 2 [Dinothrombium tinctorium]
MNALFFVVMIFQIVKNIIENAICKFAISFSHYFLECNNLSDGDEERDVEQIIRSRGFQVETHSVTTEDGYILTVHRIINPESKTKPKRPVILQHGLLGSGIDFIINSPGIGNETSSTVFRDKTVSKNLGFALSIFDYDVWLANSRGNTYGLGHLTLNPNKDKDFWNFSFDEMIEFDLPALIKYVLNITKNCKFMKANYQSNLIVIATLAYIGHSQGNMLMFGLLASQPQYCNIIRPFIALSPVTRMAHLKSPFALVCSNPSFFNYLYRRGGALIPNKRALNCICKKGCKFLLFREFCSTILFLFCGFDQEQLNKERLPTYMSHAPAGTSARNMAHLGQNMHSKKFQKFDYGCEKNLKKYGTDATPVYDLKNVDSKNIALLHSQNDFISDPEDLNFLRKEVKGKFFLDHQVNYSNWNHIDYIWGREAEKYVNIIVLEILENF